MPVWNGARFVAAALQSALAQTYDAIRVRVSVDPSTDDSLAACRAFERDPRVQVVVQPERRGWVGNTNELIRSVETEYFCILPQDDVLDPRYVGALHAHLERHPEAVCAYSDIATFGAGVHSIEQLALTGPPVRRLVTFLLARMAAVAFRGLIARRRLPGATLLRANAAGDYAADTVWMLDLACAGELHRVEGDLYAKRLHDESETRRWTARPAAQRQRDWTEHCVECAHVALAAVAEPAARAAVMVAAAIRFARRQAFLAAADPGELDASAMAAARAEFHARTGIPADLAAAAALARTSAAGALLAAFPEATADAERRARAAASGAAGADDGPARARAFRALAQRVALEAAPDAAPSPAALAAPPGADPAPAVAEPSLSIVAGSVNDAAPAVAEPSLSFVAFSADAAALEQLRGRCEAAFAGHRVEFVAVGDARSLAEAYNRGVDRSSGDVVVFAQDDVEFLSADFARRLFDHLAAGDLVGLAGTTRLAGPSWVGARWPHIHGCMAHPQPGGALAFEWFGPSAATGAQAVDGFFFAAPRALCREIRFDEATFDGRHLYDIDFSYRAHLAGARTRIGCDLLAGVARRYDPSWRRYANRFMEKHGDRLIDVSPRREPDWATLRFATRAAALAFHRRMLAALRADATATAAAGGAQRAAARGSPAPDALQWPPIKGAWR